MSRCWPSRDQTEGCRYPQPPTAGTSLRPCSSPQTYSSTYAYVAACSGTPEGRHGKHCVVSKYSSMREEAGSCTGPHHPATSYSGGITSGSLWDATLWVNPEARTLSLVQDIMTYLHNLPMQGGHGLRPSHGKLKKGTLGGTLAETLELVLRLNTRRQHLHDTGK